MTRISLSTFFSQLNFAVPNADAIQYVALILIFEFPFLRCHSEASFAEESPEMRQTKLLLTGILASAACVEF